MVVPQPDSQGPFHRFNAIERQVYFSAFHLKSSTAAAYVKAMVDHKTVWLTGYAVSIALLARFMLSENISPPPHLKAIITTSEKLTSAMRRTIEAAFKVRVYEEYSTVENALFASECSEGRLHLSPEIGVVEILRPDGSQCNPGEIEEVVVTNISRYYHPLIRFRLGDTAAINWEPCPCGREMPIIQDTIGRLEDVIIGPDGRQNSSFYALFWSLPNVIEGQIVQHALDQIEIRIVATAQYNEADNKELIDRMKKRLGYDVNIWVTRVKEIPRTKAGKFKAVISLLKDSPAQIDQ